MFTVIWQKKNKTHRENIIHDRHLSALQKNFDKLAKFIARSSDVFLQQVLTISATISA